MCRYAHCNSVGLCHTCNKCSNCTPQCGNVYSIVDTGLVIPCISSELHHKVCEAAIELGLGITRQIEIFGVNASQMALNLLGGGNR